MSNELMDAGVVQWVTTHFLPFESELRGILRRVCASAAEVDDVVQETYYKILTMGSMDHVREPRAFLVRTAKNIVTDKLRREAIVSIETMASLEDLDVPDASPSVERVAMARSELSWVIGLVGRLPERCREVFRSRRLYGLSQNETAQILGISEGIVEQEMMKGMHLISAMVAGQGEATPGSALKRKGRKRHVGH